jgi:glycosyltransferase involved in cell wall biosynthesis
LTKPSPFRLEGCEAGAAGAAGEAEGSILIEVALATFNSERFLSALLDSLLDQTRQDFTILVSDDASTDGTQRLLARYAAAHPGRFRLLPPNASRLGVIGNFDRLLAHATADYVFLCDHDDVWLPQKIERSLEAMHRLEAAHPAGTPLLVHADLIVVGPELELLHPSFFAYSGIDPRRSRFVQLLLANVVTGCTTVINRPLCARVGPIPREAVMYDHWLALVAAMQGAITYVDEPLVLYRQHEGNAIGAQAPRSASFLQRVYGTLWSRERERLLRRYTSQAAILAERFAADMSPPDLAAAQSLAQLWKMPRFGRFARLRRCGLGLEGLVRNVALFIVVTRARRAARPRHDGAGMVGPEGFEPPTKPL